MRSLCPSASFYSASCTRPQEPIARRSTDRPADNTRGEHHGRSQVADVERPSDLIVAIVFTCKYDACNRLAEVKQGEAMVARYEYDGLSRRVKEHIDERSPPEPNGVDVYQHLFYNVGWQAAETL